MNGLIFLQRYKVETTTYNERISLINSIQSTRDTAFYKRPSLLMLIAEGEEKFRPKEYWLSPNGKPYASPYTSLPRNYTLPDIPELDWSFIIKIMFSLYILLMGYNSISGEKENGTLRLILSNSTSRTKVLVAKYIAILLTVLIPLIVGMLISLVIMSNWIPVFTSEMLEKLFLVLLLTVAYVSIFIFISLWFSSLFEQSSIVLFMLLIMWIIFTIVPDVSGIIAKKYTIQESEYQIVKTLQELESGNTRLNIINQIKKDIEQSIAHGELKTEEDIEDAVRNMIGKKNIAIIAQKDAYENFIKNREIIAYNLSRLSPMALFQYALETIAETGIKREERFLSSMNAYSMIYDQYIGEKIGEIVGDSEYGGRWIFTLGDKQIEVNTPKPKEYEGDKSDFPRFIENKPSLRQIFSDSAVDIIGLLLWNLVLAIGAFLAFNRADVR